MVRKGKQDILPQKSGSSHMPRRVGEETSNPKVGNSNLPRRALFISHLTLENQVVGPSYVGLRAAAFFYSFLQISTISLHDYLTVSLTLPYPASSGLEHADPIGILPPLEKIHWRSGVTDVLTPYTWLTSQLLLAILRLANKGGQRWLLTARPAIPTVLIP